MIANLIRFLSVVLFITFTTHYFLFFSWCRFFHIQSHTIKVYLFVTLSFLSITFIVASICMHMANTPITRAYYLLSGTWMGLMGFLLIATVIIWAVKGGLWIVPHTLPTNTIIHRLSVILYCLAVLYTGVCHYQFYKLKIRSITVPIQNLPQYWEGKKIIQLSDLHLGGTKDLAFIKEVVRLTNNMSADLILITGDLFDGATNSQERYVPDLNTFKATHGTVFTSGNHEIYSGIEKARRVIEESNIILLDNTSIVIEGLQILGISYPEINNSFFFDFDDPSVFTKQLPTIMLYHTPTSIKANGKTLNDVSSSDYLAPDTNFANNKKHNIALQLSGHTHAGQFIPWTWVADKVFKGFHYGLHRIDDDHYINISSGTGSWGPPLRSGVLSEIVIITLVKG